MKTRKAILIVLALSFCAVAPTAEAKRRDKGKTTKAPATEVVDVFWSMRSPYCYIALDRIQAARQRRLGTDQQEEKGFQQWRKQHSKDGRRCPAT